MYLCELLPVVEKVFIENFRSIQKLEIKLDKINALIGPNNAGKSNILKAVGLVLGETWPSPRVVDDNDFIGMNRNNKITIRVSFDQYLIDKKSQKKVYGFSFECQDDDSNFYALDSGGNPLTYSNGFPVRVTQDMRDEIPLVFVDVDRQSSQQVKSSQWTLYGKILKYLGSKIPDAKKSQFQKMVLSAFDSEIFDVSQGSDLKHLEDALGTSMKEQTGFDLILELSILDPVEAIKNVRPYLKEGTNTNKHDPEEMGAGTQSALTIAIARAYNEIVKKGAILAIEEPELHFHPQACRNFYNNLNMLSENGLQVIYTTHSPFFVDISKFENLHIIRKKNSSTVIESGLNLLSTGFQRSQIITKFNEGVNQSLFADFVVLVEGPDDEVACKSMLEKMGFDINKSNVSVVSCGGRDNIPHIAKVLNFLKITTLALVDEDPGNAHTASTLAQLEGIIGTGSVFLQSPNLEGMFGSQRKFDQIYALKFFQNYQGSVPQVYIDIISNLTHNSNP